MKKEIVGSVVWELEVGLIDQNNGLMYCSPSLCRDLLNVVYLQYVTNVQFRFLKNRMASPIVTSNFVNHKQLFLCKTLSGNILNR